MARYNWHYVVVHTPYSVQRTSFVNKSLARAEATRLREHFREKGLKQINVYLEKIETKTRRSR